MQTFENHENSISGNQTGSEQEVSKVPSTRLQVFRAAVVNLVGRIVEVVRSFDNRPLTRILGSYRDSMGHVYTDVKIQTPEGKRNRIVVRRR